MSNVLNEIQQLRLILIKETNFDLAKAEKLYNFIIGDQQKALDKFNDFLNYHNIEIN